ncbi:hypothetical protein LEWO105114_10375 [Legionella worsleiensis]|nr:Uncharacterised protein [Legionella worsleiensis]
MGNRYSVGIQYSGWNSSSILNRQLTSLSWSDAYSI